VLLVLLAAVLLAGCSAAQPTRAPAPTNLDAAIATASTSVANASTYIFSLEQALPGAPSNEDLERLQSTLNLAATQTGAAQIATSQEALSQFEAGIATVTQAYEAAAEGSTEQQPLGELRTTLEVGRDALDGALR